MMRWMTISKRHIKYSCWYAVYLYLNLRCLIFHAVLTDSSRCPAGCCCVVAQSAVVDPSSLMDTSALIQRSYEAVDVVHSASAALAPVSVAVYVITTSGA